MLQRIMLALLMLGFGVQGLAENAKTGITCKQPYAICTTAVCVPMPGVEGKALCFCNVADGISFGNLSCEQRKPQKSHGKTYNIVSTFSFDDAPTNSVMSCPAGHAWTNCLNKPCQIDPRNSNQALCTCDIEQSTPFITFGGECDTSTCNNTLYSGAPLASLDEATGVLLKAMNLAKSPVKTCPPKQK